MNDSIIEEFNEYGQDAGLGNLLAVQPYLIPDDYASEEFFYSRLSACFQLAGHKGWLSERTVAVLPEYVGTWLVGIDESPAVFHAASITTAMRTLVLRHPLAFGRCFLS